MGNVQVNETRQILSDYTKIVNDVVNSVYNTAISQCTAGNTLSIQTGGVDCPFEFTNGTFNIFQVAGTNCTLTSSNISQLGTTLKNEIQNKTQQFLEQQSQNEQGWLAVALSLQINQATNVTEITNQIFNSINNNIINSCSSVSNALNTGQLKLCGVYNGATFNINQNATVTALTSCVNQAVINTFVNNPVLNDLVQKTEQKLKSKQEGIGALTWVLLAGAVFLVVAIIAFIIFKVATRPKA